MKSLACIVVVLVCHEAYAQSLLSDVRPGHPVALLPSDSAVLELQEPRHDIGCSVTALRPQLGFDFLFHAGYRLTIPLKDLAGTRNKLIIIFRVYPATRPDDPIYFSQGIEVPPLNGEHGGDASLVGGFLVGSGRYHVDWLMRDYKDRFCSAFWDIDARLNTKDGPLAHDIAQDLVQPVQRDPFADEFHVAAKNPGRLLNVKIIANFAPHNPSHAILGSNELNALIGILRQISRDPHIGKYSVVACSLQSQNVIHRQQSDLRIDLPALGKALTPVSFATIGVSQLTSTNTAGDFLSGLLTDELTKERVDALIVISTDCDVSLRAMYETPSQIHNVPLFYLNYKAAPLEISYDTIGRFVKHLHGREYVISYPRDLFHAWSDILSQIAPGSSD